MSLTRCGWTKGQVTLRGLLLPRLASWMERRPVMEHEKAAASVPVVSPPLPQPLMTAARRVRRKE
eukprot:1850152-Rhodomonas_salina.2